jgi:competence protein ComEC
VLDVGQGDAILVREGQHAILVDAGPSASAMRAALARAGVRSLDAVVITHLHADHYGGLGGLEGLVKVPVVFVASGALGADSPALDVAMRLAGRRGVRELCGGMSLRLEHLVLDVVWPREEVDDAATNEASVVLRAREGAFSALLTGDAEAIVLDQLVRDGTLGDIDVLKVGHHGSAEAVSQVDMGTLRPEWALISVGRGNRFGHPTGSTVRLLAESGSRVVRTDQSGDVTVNIDERGAYNVTVAWRTTTAARDRPPQRVRELRWTRESATMPCAPDASELTESHGQRAFRVQAHLPHLRRARPPPRARAGEAQRQCG